MSSHNNSIVRIAEGSLSRVAGAGLAQLTKDLTLSSVLYVPNLDCNLLSISQLTHDLYYVAKFFPNLCEFQAWIQGGRLAVLRCVVASIYSREILLYKNKFLLQVAPLKSQSILYSLSNKDEVMLWHYRLGHPNFVYLENLFPHLFINKSPSSYYCEICQLSKHTRNFYPSIPYKPSHPFSMIHNDVWGPTRVKNITGSQCFVSFIDGHTRTTWIFLMKEISEVGRIFQSFDSMITTQFLTKIKVLKTDNARKYFNSILGLFI